MPRGTQLLRFPFGWLSDFAVEAYNVLTSVQPTVDVGQHNPEILGYTQTFVAGAGLNTIILPGPNRAGNINAGVFPIITSKGARRWLGLAIATNTALAAGDNIQLTYGQQGSGAGGSHALSFVAGTTLFPANVPLPLIRGYSNRFNAAGNVLNGWQGSIYVPDPDYLFISIQSMVGGELLTVSGLFLESDDRNQPLPDMFA
jgi:hypothetical protein